MRKLANLATLGFLFAHSGPCMAQGWPPWADELFGNRRSGYDRRQEEPIRPPRSSEDRRPPGGDIRSGGPQPAIVAATPPIVEFQYEFPANSIVIDTGSRKLYYVLPDKKAYEYRISVGREGFNWTGTEKVSRKQQWPDWHPPAEMRERDPSLPEKMTGGVRNPLGAIALYLGNTLYRIHGTNDAKSIGHAQSSGCFRLLNASVLHLASITEIGTSVTVVASLLELPKVSRAPEVAHSPPANQPPATANEPSPSANQAPPPINQSPQQASRPPAEIPRPPVAAARSEQPPPRDNLPDYGALRNYTLNKR